VITNNAASIGGGAVMRGDDEVLALLNEQLTSELTAINQYFLHAKMQANWGFTKLAEHTKNESFDEMRHAERITERILFLEGLPNYQQLFRLRIGQTVKEQLEADLAVEREVVDRLRPGIAMCRNKCDIPTANLFEDILASEEDHIDYLETNLQLIDKLGEQLYLSQLVERPPTTS
jgi:bacterioferritin